MKATWLILLILLGCRNESEFVEQGGRLLLKNVEMKVSNLSDTDWQVGRPRRRTSLTQSVVFTVDLPYLTEDARDLLYKKYEMDGWILRLTHRRENQEIVLGEVYAPMAGTKHTRQREVEINQTKSISLKIFYAAAYISERFRSFDCPAFLHDRRVDDISIEGDFSPFDLEVSYPVTYSSRPLLAELTPSAFNAGNSITGEYTIEAALYSLKNKTIATKWVPLKEKVVIGSEERVKVNGCAGIRPELNDKKKDPVREVL